MRLFLTGASGCVGHYLVESLLQSTDYELFLLVRNPQKLLFPPHPRITVIPGRLQDIDCQRELLQTIDIVISAAAAWGGREEVFATNVTGTLRLLELLNPDRLRLAIYFSTASILDSQNHPLPQAATIGTDYIKSKYQALQKIEKMWLNDRLIVVFPTLVFGGAKDKPYSHLSGGLREVTRYIKLIKWLRVDGTFHFIHAQDIATVISYLVSHPPSQLPQRLVLGNPPITVNQAIAEACDLFQEKIYWQFSLTPWLIDVLINLFQIRMAEWDRFCLAQRHFIYQAINPATFSLPCYYPQVKDLLAEVSPRI
ncbi:MAG: NAD(P)-dependent oxidoreductase [Pseudanabaenaceae cyanobacterium SKYGB_i_bin29]|nr:NAD(P)-dependent oxidoreductase [Pseudanabaenaceae cyanobacterium SKYG29]MDW8421868.1 NAD(P)-dependent oxidoreductase [Pseudanabaenaceae cyanobacterium SKYGB_i_bin29]